LRGGGDKGLSELLVWVRGGKRLVKKKKGGGRRGLRTGKKESQRCGGRGRGRGARGGKVEKATGDGGGGGVVTAYYWASTIVGGCNGGGTFDGKKGRVYKSAYQARVKKKKKTSKHRKEQSAPTGGPYHGGGARFAQRKGRETPAKEKSGEKGS